MSPPAPPTSTSTVPGEPARITAIRNPPPAGSFERLLKRLRIPAGSVQAALAAGVWDLALVLAAPVSMRLGLGASEFMALFGPYAKASRHLMSRLERCPRVWLLAATIGPALENRVQDMFAGGEAFSGYLLEYFGVWLTDQSLRGEIAALRSLPGVRPGDLTGRLIPGCRDFPLESQAVFVGLAGPGLGLTLTSGSQLHPRMSVTAVIGHGF